ncbi:hypothetical protein [Candidatus Liberibacter solanacearum]|uniref:hypothetical protein n=1 Tax=Candidatus Liberibacter solanacearum TaxID=556287 RepID=UPI0013010741|nr:hypothetical protein [Candidatus Liberibacter solanacearum]
MDPLPIIGERISKRHPEVFRNKSHYPLIAGAGEFEATIYVFGDRRPIPTISLSFCY